MARARPGRDLPPPVPANPFDSGWRNGLRFQEIFDYGYDGIMRSFDDSQQRMGRPEIDLLFVHDIGRVTHGERHDGHWDALVTGGFRALAELRAAGLIKGLGLGVNEAEAIDAAMDEADLDCCLLAGRYTLLDRSGGGAPRQGEGPRRRDRHGRCLQFGNSGVGNRRRPQVQLY